MNDNAPTTAGPLSGIRVIDLTAMVMGPYCTQIMADMGAEVIKIEPPRGDDTRYISVGPEPGMSGVFVNVNRGKRSVVLDLRTEEGAAALRTLVADADVFVHSMRAAAIERLGFGYDAVAALNPSIVYTNCYGYGRTGPDADLPAYDDTVQAECGIPFVQERLTGSPGFAGTIIADKVAGMTALYATTMALFHRERTGEGQEVEVAMFETMAAFMLVEHANGALFDPPLGPAGYPRAITPNRKPYRTADGHLAALVYNDKHWNTFVEALRPPWAGPEFATLAQRAARIDTVYAHLADTFLQRTTGEWLELLRALEIPAAPVRSLDELFDNPHLNATGFFQTVDSPNGPVRFPGPPTWFSRTPGRVGGPAPRLGADTEEVLSGLRVSTQSGARAGDEGPLPSRSVPAAENEAPAADADERSGARSAGTNGRTR
ncbi:CaiB/BaiF CoA transferase family protein [Nocardia shimofusensis]|uniref:CaiB/BaiF CoA transferase family protein n=1 Tax=Nocardia shimofusensis TaxID=228596 RepID=UPI000A00C254|nr:CoA transferase [Nocardia shimofusensis]